MTSISTEAVRQFVDAMNGCMERVGGGRVKLDPSCLRALVRDNREVAERVAMLRCVEAVKGQQAVFQGAYLIGLAYQVEFSNSSVANSVRAQARAAGAESVLKGISLATP